MFRHVDFIFQVAKKHGSGGADAQSVGGSDNVDPVNRFDFVRANLLAQFVIKDVSVGPVHGVKPFLLKFGQDFGNALLGALGDKEYFQRGESLNMDARESLGYSFHHFSVVGKRQSRIDSAVDADFIDIGGLSYFFDDFVNIERKAAGFFFLAEKRAIPAAIAADISVADMLAVRERDGVAVNPFIN